MLGIVPNERMNLLDVYVYCYQGRDGGLKDHVQHRGGLHDLQQLRCLLSSEEAKLSSSFHLRGQTRQLGGGWVSHFHNIMSVLILLIPGSDVGKERFQWKMNK